MEKLTKEGTDETPEITLDQEGGIFEIKGRSLPEDPGLFYAEIKEWVSRYAQSPNDRTEFKIFLDYFNSTSAKKIFGILMELESIANAGKEVKVIWYYKKDDELMEAKGEEIQSLLEVDMEIIEA